MRTRRQPLVFRDGANSLTVGRSNSNNLTLPQSSSLTVASNDPDDHISHPLLSAHTINCEELRRIPEFNNSTAKNKYFSFLGGGDDDDTATAPPPPFSTPILIDQPFVAPFLFFAVAFFVVPGVVFVRSTTTHRLTPRSSLTTSVTTHPSPNPSTALCTFDQPRSPPGT